MNDTLDDGEKDKSRLDSENVQYSEAHDTQIEDGTLRKVGDGEQYSDVYWDDAVATTLRQTHPRIPELQTLVQCKYKFADGMLKVRTTHYKMTTRNGNWDRANIDLAVFGGHNQVRKDSPDTMLQDNKWHPYDIVVESALGPAPMGMWISIRVDYDGKDNDVGPTEGWGPELYPAREPLIESPVSGAEVAMPFVVSGKNGHQYGEVGVFAQTSGAGILLGKTPVKYAGDWNLTVTLPPNILSFYALQFIAEEESKRSNTVTIRLPDPYRAPLIYTPANGVVLPTGTDLLLKGSGTPDKVIDVMTPGGAILHATTTVMANGIWEALFNLDNYPNGGPVEMTVGHRDMNDWSQPQSFILLARPTITTPGNGAVTDPRGPISGEGGTSGAIVEVLKDLDHSFKVGQGAVGTNGQWSITTFTREMPPGPFPFVARQTLQSVRSNTSEPRGVKVRPPALTAVDVNFPTETSVKFSGAGHSGAVVEVRRKGGDVLGTSTVTNGSWQVDIQDLVPGSYTFQALQKVSDGSGGFIPSENSADIDVVVGVPEPTLNPPTNLPSQKPRFSGTGTTWEGQPATQVQIQLNETAHPFVPNTTVAGTGWEVTATHEIAPGTYLVRARQMFGSQASNWVDLPGSMIIPAPLPAIETIIENGLSPDISGTCWPGAQVRLWYDDAAGDVHLPLVTGTTWRFRRPESFPPGPHKVTVTQTFGGQTSGEVFRTFTVAVPRPIITRPIDEPVGHETSVEGHGGIAGGVMKIFDYVTDLPLGEAPVAGRDWSVALKALEYGRYRVYARQFFDGYPSEKSERVTFEVVLLAPDIDVPQSGDDVARTFSVEGCARVAAEVELRLDGVFLARVRANVRGEWWYRATLPLGPGVLQAKQFLDERESALSPVRGIRVVPAQPVMETPAAGQAVERRMAISGFGYPGDTVTVARVDSPDIPLGSAVVQENTTWSFWADLDAMAGHYELVAQQSCQGYDSGWSGERAIVLHTDPPQFVEPLSGRWVPPRPLLKGTGKPGMTVKLTAWYNSDVELTKVPITGGANWQAEPSQNMPQGAAWASARQVDSTGEPVSASGESERFEVLSPEVTSHR